MNDPNLFNLEPWRVDLSLLGAKKHAGGFQRGFILQRDTAAPSGTRPPHKKRSKDTQLGIPCQPLVFVREPRRRQGANGGAQTGQAISSGKQIHGGNEHAADQEDEACGMDDPPPFVAHILADCGHPNQKAL